MTVAYNFFFVTIWGSAVLAVPAAIGLLTWLIVTSIPHEHRHSERIVMLTLAVLVLLAWTIGLRRHAYRVLIRAGAWPAWCRGDAFPHDELEFRQAVVDTKARGRWPTVVGGGWSFFLKRRGPPAPRIFTHRFSGEVSPGRFRAGTTIAEVNKRLLKSGLTLPSHPTMDYISIGAWLAHPNHGNGGDAQTASAITDATVLDMETNTTQRIAYAQARKLFDERLERYAVLDVSFRAVPNELLQKRGILVRDAQSAADWLAPGAELRLLFLGAARDYAIGLRWERPYDQSSHRDPHVCSRFCQFFQVDICSIVLGWNEPMSKFNGKMTRYNANRWVPYIVPLFTIATILSGVKNFEIMFLLPEALSGNTLWRILSDAIQMHKTHGGRSEFRYGKPGAQTTVYWDLSMSRGHSAPFELLYSLGVTRVAMHTGKFDVASTDPCTRVSMSTLMATPV